MEIFKIFSITKIYLYKYLILKECWYTVFTVSIHFQYVIYIQSESSLSSSIFFVLYNYFLLLFSFYSMQMSETPQNSYNYFLFNLLCSRYYVTWFNLNFFIYLFVFFLINGSHNYHLYNIYKISWALTEHTRILRNNCIFAIFHLCKNCFGLYYVLNIYV